MLKVINSRVYSRIQDKFAMFEHVMYVKPILLVEMNTIVPMCMFTFSLNS